MPGVFHVICFFVYLLVLIGLFFVIKSPAEIRIKQDIQETAPVMLYNPEAIDFF